MSRALVPLLILLGISVVLSASISLAGPSVSGATYAGRPAQAEETIPPEETVPLPTVPTATNTSPPVVLPTDTATLDPSISPTVTLTPTITRTAWPMQKLHWPLIYKNYVIPSGE